MSHSSAKTVDTQPRQHTVVGTVGALVAVAIAAINLRPSISAVGPVIDSVLEFVGAGGAVGGLLTAIPGIAFCVVGLCAVLISRRLGLTGALVVGMIAVLVGQIVRPWIPNPVVFLVLSTMGVAGIALANVLLPAWIKAHGGSASVRLMTLYTCVLGLGGSLGPLTALMFNADAVDTARVEGTVTNPAPWQLAIVAWAIVAVLQLVVWLPIWGKVRYDYPPEPPAVGRKVAIWRSPTAVALMLFFGLQSMNAYIQMGWLPSILIDAGVASAHATLTAVVVNAMGIVGGLVMPSIIARSSVLWRYTVGFAALTALGWALVILINVQGAAAFPAWFAYLVALILGTGGFCFPTAIALIAARTADPAITARLSGFVQPVGYILAAAGPFLVGTVASALNNWVPVLAALVLLAAVMGVVGFRAAANVTVDEELGAPPTAS